LSKILSLEESIQEKQEHLVGSFPAVSKIYRDRDIDLGIGIATWCAQQSTSSAPCTLTSSLNARFREEIAQLSRTHSLSFGGPECKQKSQKA